MLLNCCNGTHTNIQTHCCTLLLGSAFLWHRFIKHYSNKPQNWSSFCAYYWAKKLQLFTSLSHLTGFLFPFIQKSIHTNIKQFKILVPQKSACLQKPTFGLLKTLCLLLDTPWVFVSVGHYVQSFVEKIHSRKRKCIPFFTPLPSLIFFSGHWSAVFVLPA